MANELNGGFLHQIPTTPEAARAEQKRVLEPLQKYNELRAEYEKEDEAYWLEDAISHGGAIYPARLETKRRKLERLREDVEALLTFEFAQRNIDLLGLIATLLEAQAERERVIEQVQKLIRAARNDLDILSGSVTLDGETTCDDLGENLDAVLRALATAPAGGE